MKCWLPFLCSLLAVSAYAYAPERKPFLPFDAANRLTNTITPLNRQTAVTYDARGLISTVREPSGQTTTNFYDAKGRLTNSADSVASRVYRYDANNNVTNIIENGRTNTWTFDAYDRASSYRDADGNLIQYRYDANGNLTNLIYPGNRTVAYAYDSLNRLTNVTDWAGRKTVMTYDLASRVTSLTRPNGTQRTLAYDAASQTTNIWERLTNGTPIALFKFNWNNAARVAWEFAAPLPHAYTPPTRTMTFDEDNRIATFNGNAVTHDLDGNMTSGPLTNNTFATYTYDARNRLSAIGALAYAYDPAGNRTALTNGTNVVRFVVNPNAALSQVLMRVKSGVTNFYIYGLGLLYEITETATSTNTATYHYDYRGSTVALSDGSGNVTDRIEYSPYATTTYRSGTNDTPFLYNGRYGVQTDANGLLYMRARYYNPYLCRFLNADPSSFSGGLNFYAYADGNPVSMMDPFGLGAVGEGTGSSWLSTAWNVTKGVGLVGAGFVPWLGDAIEAYTVVAPGSSGLDRTLSGVSLTANAWTAGLLPNLGPIKGGINMITDAFGGAAETGASRLRLNIFGEGEARGFLDVSSNARFANGRPLTSGLGNGSASDIFIRSAPITGENTIPEILRLSQPGTRVTLMQPASGFQGQALIDAFGSRATVDFMRTFPSQTVAPGVDMTILRMTVGGR